MKRITLLVGLFFLYLASFSQSRYEVKDTAVYESFENGFNHKWSFSDKRVKPRKGHLSLKHGNDLSKQVKKPWKSFKIEIQFNAEKATSMGIQLKSRRASIVRGLYDYYDIFTLDYLHKTQKLRYSKGDKSYILSVTTENESNYISIVYLEEQGFLEVNINGQKIVEKVGDKIDSWGFLKIKHRGKIILDEIGIYQIVSTAEVTNNRIQEVNNYYLATSPEDQQRALLELKSISDKDELAQCWVNYIEGKPQNDLVLKRISQSKDLDTFLETNFLTGIAYRAYKGDKIDIDRFINSDFIPFIVNSRKSFFGNTHEYTVLPKLKELSKNFPRANKYLGDYYLKIGDLEQAMSTYLAAEIKEVIFDNDWDEIISNLSLAVFVEKTDKVGLSFDRWFDKTSNNCEIQNWKVLIESSTPLKEDKITYDKACLNREFIKKVNSGDFAKSSVYRLDLANLDLANLQFTIGDYENSYRYYSEHQSSIMNSKSIGGYYFALMYLYGLYPEKDSSKAMKLMSMACENGNLPACGYLLTIDDTRAKYHAGRFLHRVANKSERLSYFSATIMDYELKALQRDKLLEKAEKLYNSFKNYDTKRVSNSRTVSDIDRTNWKTEWESRNQTRTTYSYSTEAVKRNRPRVGSLTNEQLADFFIERFDLKDLIDWVPPKSH